MRAVVTGGIASGKSLFSSFLREEGIETRDADDIVRALESPGGAAVDEIRSAFGNSVVAPDGSIDRKALADIVFAPGGEKARRSLEKILHPAVRDELLRWLDGSPPGVFRAAVVPLLFESGWEGDFDMVVCLSAGEAIRTERLSALRGMDAAHAKARIAAQMPDFEREKRSTLVVRNEGSVEELRKEARRVALEIKRKYADG